MKRWNVNPLRHALRRTIISPSFWVLLSKVCRFRHPTTWGPLLSAERMMSAAIIASGSSNTSVTLATIGGRLHFGGFRMGLASARHIASLIASTPANDRSVVAAGGAASRPSPAFKTRRCAVAGKRQRLALDFPSAGFMEKKKEYLRSYTLRWFVPCEGTLCAAARPMLHH